MNFLSKIFFIVLFSTLIIQAQITEEYKQDKINSLSIISIDSASTKHYGGNAIEPIMRHRIVEAIPAIIENIWIQDPYYQTRFLHALWALGSPECENLTLAYLDSVDNFAESHFTKYELKEIATELLFRIGNYSTYQYIFEAIDSVYPSINESVVNALPYIIEYVPQAKERAKNELLRIANECEDPVFRWYAASGLDEALGEEAVPSIINLFRNEEDSSPRGLIALHILSKYKRADAIMALKEQLLTDTNESVRGNIVDALILGANTLDAHKFILDHLENETSFWVKALFYDDMFTIEPYLDSTISTSTMLDTLTSYTDQSYGYEWLKDEPYKTELLTKLTTAKTKLTTGDSLGCRIEVATFQNSVNQVYQDSSGSYPKYVSNAGYKFMYHYAQYILDRLPEAPTTEGLPVKLEDSQGNLLQGGYLQYYEGGWQDATNNGDGTFTVGTERSTVSIKMLYAGGSQQQNNVTVGADTAVFQTSDIVVKLLSSQNTLLDSGLVQYYASGWQDFGTLANGVAHKELLSKNYTFKIKYAGSEKNIVQNLDTNTTVIFHTVNTEVQLKDSQGNFLDGGTVEYFASGWKDFGVAPNGKANKELLSRAYTFKIHYANAENNLVQNLDSSTTVVFNTVNANVHLKDSQNNLLDGGVVQYFASGWQEFGTATNGVATKELLPKSYNFKMKYGGTDKNIVQDLATGTTIIFNTVNTEIQLRDSQGNLLDGGFAKYYASGWKDFGEATNGIAHKELLSRAYTFKIQYGGADMNHVQNLDTNTTVMFNTISVTAQLKDSQGNLLDGGTVEYYAAGWKPFGAATNGTVAKELLTKSYTFKILYGGLNTTKVQDVSTNSTVDFATTLTTIKVKDNQNQAIENAEALYYGGGWKQIGNTTANGEVTKEILARNITFKAKQGTIQKNKLQDTSTNSVVEIILE